MCTSSISITQNGKTRSQALTGCRHQLLLPLSPTSSRKPTSEWFLSSLLHVDSILFALSAAVSQSTSSPGDPIATAMLSAPITNASLATNSSASMTIAAFLPRTLLATAVFNHACKLPVNLLRRPEAFISFAPKENAGFMKGRLLPLENSTNWMTT
jgi:hypothetical protein